MKKIIFSLLIACFFFACSDNTGLIPSVNDVNEPGPVEEQELIPVSFNLGFSQEVTPMAAPSLRASSSAFNFKYLDYLLFIGDFEDDFPWASRGTLYKKHTFIDSDGYIRDSLPAGDYYFVFAANNESPFLFTGNNLLEEVIMTTDQSAVPEVFYNKIYFAIENKSVNSMSCPLFRKVGKVEIVVKDIMPENVETIEISVQPLGSAYVIDELDDWTQMSGSLSHSYSMGDYVDRTIPPFSFLSYSNRNQGDPETGITTRTPVTITIKALGSGGSLIAEKQINNVDIFSNYIVRYTGRLFENTAFSLSLNEEWTEEENTY
jgi:hypothetical protein